MNRHLEKPTVLVTGGAGFIGSHVSESLLKNKYRVVVLDDLSGGNRGNLPEGVVFEFGSIANHELVNALFEKYRFSYVFHLAAYAAEVLSHHIKRYNYTNNLLGSINLINAAVNNEVKCFVFTSSIGVYGDLPSPLVETMKPNPKDSYGIAKYAVELELRSCQEMFGLDYIIFRPHNVYGERQNIGDRYRNVIGIFLNQIMAGRPMTIFGDGSQTRAFSYISDVAPLIARSIEVSDAYNETFNLGVDQAYSVNHLATIVAKAMDTEPNIRYLPTRFEVSHAICNHTKQKSFFGDTETISLEEGIRRMALWAKENGVRQSSSFSEIEIPKNLPSAWINQFESEEGQR